MAITQKTIQVVNSEGNTEEFMITAFTATKGIKLFKQLVKLLGPSFKALQSAENENEAIAKALDCLFESMGEVELEVLMKDLIQGVSKGNMAVNFEMEFQADYAKLFKIAQEVIALNWGSLFTMLGMQGQ